MKLIPLKVPWRVRLIRIASISRIKHITSALLTVATVFVLSGGSALADSFDDQITVLKQQAAAQQQQASTYHAQANNYRTRVSELQAQINSLRNQIAVTNLQTQKVNLEIDDAKAKMQSQKAILSENIKTMYLGANVTPLEMLASSANIGDFFNQQAYQDKIKDKVIASMQTINDLKAKLEVEQQNLQGLLANQQQQQQQVQASQAEANNLLALAAQSASQADAQVKQSNTDIGNLKAQQAAALMAKFGSSILAGGTCGGGYPAKWCNAGQDSLIDNWGMFNRECVSYTAFKVWASGRNMPYWGGRGNAKQWPGNAQAAGIPVDSNPKAGDVAISMLGPYGHAMYVEGVSNGKIYVSQYNYGNNGEYSTMTISSSGLYFIHF